MDGIGPGGTGHAPFAVEPEGRRAATMLSLLLLAVLVGAGLIVFATQLLDRPAGAQVEAPSSPSPSPSADGASAMLAQPFPTASLAPLPGASADPARLPRFPGSSVVGYDDGVDGLVSWVVIEYLAAAATLDEVREHYREVFRESDWFVGDVDYLDGVWTFTVNQGTREARLELSDEGEGVRAVAFVSDAAPAVTPRPSPVPAKAAPTTKPVPETRTPRVEPPRDQPPPPETKPRPRPRDDDRPRPTPDRRPDRDDDRDDDDDDRDDDDDDD